MIDIPEWEGINKFVKSWDELVQTVRAALDTDDEEMARSEA